MLLVRLFGLDVVHDLEDGVLDLLGLLLDLFFHAVQLGQVVLQLVELLVEVFQLGVQIGNVVFGGFLSGRPGKVGLRLLHLTPQGFDVLGGLGDGIAERQILGIVRLLAGDVVPIVQLAQLDRKSVV